MSIEATKSSRFLLHLNPSSPQRTAIATTMSTGRHTQPNDTAAAAAMVTEEDTSHWFVVLDRFVSASTGDDVTSSLQSILDTLTTTTNGDIVNDFIDIMTSTSTTVAEDEEEDMAGMVLTTLLHIYGTSEFPKHRIYIEDGISMVARIYTTILQRSKRPKDISKVLLLQPPKQAGRFVEACIDVASATTTVQPQPYPRVLALQLIQSVASHQPSIVQHQLLSTPNGIHRLGDLLLYQPTTTTTTNDTTTTATANVPEEVQLAMITLSVTTLSKWSSVAKIWIFNEIIDHVIRIAIQQEGGIYSAAAAAENTATTTGNFNVVMDCLLIIQQLLSHDTTFGELVIQSSTIFINNLNYNIFDLRNGTNFRNPPNPLSIATSTTASTTSTKPSLKSNEDDLDDLIASASKSQTDSSTAAATNGTVSAESPSQQLRLPMLTDLEEQMINLVLDILCTLLENPKISNFIIQNHANFCTLIWEMGLLTIPMGSGSNNDGPPTFTCAIPSVSLQQRTLHVIGTYLNSITILEQNIYSGYDRLLYLVCTGMGGVAAVVPDIDDTVDRGNNMYRISQAALYVVRRTIPKQTINDLLMHTLAPPPATANSIDQDDDGTDKPSSTDPQNQVTIVSKLVRTVFDNVFITPAASTDNQQPRLVCLSGALGALSLFMTDDVNRSILLRITATAATTNQDDSTKTSLIQTLFTCLVQEITNHEKGDDYFVAIQLLRFLCTWITDASEIVQVILNESTQSMMQLSQFVASTNSGSDRGEVVVAVLIHLLFGLCLHSMNNVNEDTNSGGWTRANIVTLLQRNLMISQQIDMVKNMKDIRPWSCSTYEWNIWTYWYNDSVRTVRQRIIQELVRATNGYEESNNSTNQGNGGVATDNDNNEARLSLPVDNDTAATNIECRKEMHIMRNLVTDLTQETERLRLELSESERLISTQGKLLFTWKCHYVFAYMGRVVMA